VPMRILRFLASLLFACAETGTLADDLWTYAPMFGPGARGGAAIPRNQKSVRGINETIAALSDHRLGYIAHKHKHVFANAVPFPHTIIDADEALLPRNFLEGVTAENPESGHADGHKPTFFDSFCGFFGKCTGGVSKTGTHQQGKAWVSLPDPATHPHTHALLELMKSKRFVGFLEKLTGVPDLTTDAEHHGAGLHRIGTGGSLEVHADFNNRGGTWRRRVNVFFFLNDEWKEHYGGHLELWDRNLTTCVTKILPTFGRLVIFRTTDFSFHGHPVPLNTPPHRARRSIAMYYYTRGIEDSFPAIECEENDCNLERGTRWHPMADAVHTAKCPAPNPSDQYLPKPFLARHHHSWVWVGAASVARGVGGYTQREGV